MLEELEQDHVQIEMDRNRLTINKFQLETEAADLLGTGLILNEKCQIVTQVKRILKCNPS